MTWVGGSEYQRDASLRAFVRIHCAAQRSNRECWGGGVVSEHKRSPTRNTAAGNCDYNVVVSVQMIIDTLEISIPVYV